MSLGGANGIGFDPAVPADTESASLGDDRLRSTKTSIQLALDSEHNFPSGGGDSIGYHRLGSARVFVNAQSAMSSSGTDGRLGWASDTSRLFHVGSGGTCLLGGGPNALSAAEHPSVSAPSRHAWVEEWGIGITGSTGSVLITIPNSGYSGLPLIQLTQRVTDNAATAVFLSALPADSASFVVRSVIAAGSFLSGQLFYWRSVGSRAL